MSNFIKRTEESLTFYKSRYSGIRIIFDNVKNDRIYLNFTIGIPNDKETAHGIEHLIFFGSKKYPYSLYSIADNYYGYIHGITSLCVTTYQLNALNEEGYCRLLPILMEALFDPLFSESFYTTESYFIDEEGHENGRILNEMRHKIFARDFKVVCRHENPDAYKVSDFIPNLENMRKLHKMYYRLDNCILTIKGQIDHEKVLNSIETFEKEHHFKKSSEALLDNLYKLTSIFKQNKFVNMPNIIERGMFYCLWKYDKITVREINELKLPLKYYGIVLKNLFETYEFCRRHERDTTSPFVYGFCFSRINQEKLNQSYIDSTVHEIQKIIRNTPLDMELLMEQIRLKTKEDPEDLFSRVKTYQLHGNQENDVEDGFGLYSREEEFKKLLKTDVTYWDKLIEKYFTEECTVLVFKPDENVDGEQRRKELEETNERKSQITEEVRGKISDVFRSNREFFENERKLINLDDITIEFDKNPTIEKITVEDKKEGLDIPVEYFMDSSLKKESVRFKLFFDLRGISRQYYEFLMLWLVYKEYEVFRQNIINVKADYKFEDDFAVLTISCDIKDTKKVKIILNKMSIFDGTPQSMVERLTNYQEDLRLVGKLGGIMENVLLYSPDSVKRFTMFYNPMKKMHQKLFDFVLRGYDEIKKVSDITGQLNRQILDSDAHLEVYVNDPEMITDIIFDDWPKFKNSSKIIEKPEMTYNIGKKFCIINLECSRCLLRRYLPLNFEKDSDDPIYLSVFNRYLSDILFRNILIEGTSYSVRFELIKGYGLCYCICRASNPLKLYERHKSLVLEIIESKNFDPFYFELSKRGCIYNSNDKPKMGEKLRDITLEDLIDKYGHHYLDLFNDLKTVLMLSIPESYRSRIDSDDFQFMKPDDLMLDSSFWIQKIDKENTVQRSNQFM